MHDVPLEPFFAIGRSVEVPIVTLPRHSRLAHIGVRRRTDDDRLLEPLDRLPVLWVIGCQDLCRLVRRLTGWQGL